MQTRQWCRIAYYATDTVSFGPLLKPSNSYQLGKYLLVAQATTNNPTSRIYWYSSLAGQMPHLGIDTGVLTMINYAVDGADRLALMYTQDNVGPHMYAVTKPPVVIP